MCFQAKMLKCAGNDDIVTMKAEDKGDSVTFMFESPNQDRISDFELKLMDIDSEQMGIPDADYEAFIKMPSAEFARICRCSAQKVWSLIAMHGYV
jgi:proliferating cell nuclear antigen